MRVVPAAAGVDDLTQEVRVNSNGQISLPLIGAVMAGGKTIPELEALVAEKLSEGYLQDPQVSVFVKEFTSQRAVVLFRTIDGKRAAAVYDLREITGGRMEDPQIYGDDIVMIEQSGSKTAFRRIVESIPILGVFRWY
jgi:polysaccharide export outer membrane protein